MTIHRTDGPNPALLAAAALLWLGSACGGGQKPPDTRPLPDVTSPMVEEPEDTAADDTAGRQQDREPGAQVRVDTVRPGESPGDTLPSALTEKRFDLNVPGEALKPVLRLLSHRSGVNFVIDPAVQGTVSVDLTNVNTVDALDYLLSPLGYGFRYERGAVWIKEQIFETRVFALNYAITGREGQKSLTVGAGSIGGGGLGGGGGGGGVGGAARGGPARSGAGVGSDSPAVSEGPVGAAADAEAAGPAGSSAPGPARSPPGAPPTSSRTSRTASRPSSSGPSRTGGPTASPRAGRARG